MNNWKHTKTHLILTILLLSAAIVPFVTPPTSRAAPIANDPFQHTWERTDQPVADGAVSRTWMWGPAPFSDAKLEDYAESPNGQRTVQYFDKSRMELTHPDGDQASVWYVTNGLLVVELMSGRIQVGDNAFIDRAPAQINVAGDPDDPLTYAVLAGVRDAAALAPGTAVTQRIDAAGVVTDDPSLADYGVTGATHVDETDHTVASPFWAFMTSSGLVDQDGETTTAPLFDSAYYATGFPITEAYWASVTLGGQPHEVLLQCFERRCLTYTPGNPEGWQVEAGNVGQHYYRWRYPEAPAGPNAQANELAGKVAQAGSDDERYNALLDVMDALHVGVYTGQGEMVLGGAERGAADFYLYDIELRMLAGALGRGQTYGVIDLATQLTEMGILPEGETLDPDLLRQAILNAAGSAQQTPDDFSGLAILLARQLGLYQLQPYDLFEDVALDDIRLDALSYFLLLADTSLPFIQDQLPAEGLHSDLIAQTNGVLKPAKASSPCDPSELFKGDAFKDSYGWTKTFAELLKLIPEAVSEVTGFLDAIHGAILAFSINVTELDQRLETHYGPAGHASEAGQPITFRIKVEMLDKLPQALIDCGWIAGTDFPDVGPIKGVSVLWDWEGLNQYGTLDCGPTCPTAGSNGLAIDATGDDGIAKLVFQPKDEPNPGKGMTIEETGVVTGVALYQSKFTNLLGSYAQFATPKSGATRWFVSHHEEPALKITMTLDYDIVQRLFDDTYVGTGTGTGTAVITIEHPDQAMTDPQTLAPTHYAMSGTYTMEAPIPCQGTWTYDGDGIAVVSPGESPGTVILHLVVDEYDDGKGGWSTDCELGGDTGNLVRLVNYEVALDVGTLQTIPITAAMIAEPWGGADQGVTGPATATFLVEPIVP
ncbi:MAG TPA: hypothetical protein VFV93_03550 [Thermomicrobiales bacterium]|nr:hypothetical protein [Thermomicrobiales bacterium]